MSLLAKYLQPTDVILTRNTDEVGNGTPGYWNHAAIAVGTFAGKDAIVEAQIELGVAAFEVEAFDERYPKWVVLRRDTTLTDKVVQQAIELVGMPYERLGSIFMGKYGENCVSVVRRAWRGVIPRRRIAWRRPDHIWNARDRYGFYVVAQHEDFDNWTKPAERFGGRLL